MQRIIFPLFVSTCLALPCWADSLPGGGPTFSPGDADVEGGIRLRIEDMPWKDVTEWLVDRTGVPVIGTCTPGGAFTHIGPEAVKYSIDEVVEIMNRSLAPQNLVLVRRTHSYVFVSPEAVRFFRDPRIERERE